MADDSGDCSIDVVMINSVISFFFYDTATTEIYTLSLHDALPILQHQQPHARCGRYRRCARVVRSEEHTSELQSLRHLVCRLLLEKKKKKECISHCCEAMHTKSVKSNS